MEACEGTSLGAPNGYAVKNRLKWWATRTLYHPWKMTAIRASQDTTSTVGSTTSLNVSSPTVANVPTVRTAVSASPGATVTAACTDLTLTASPSGGIGGPISVAWVLLSHTPSTVTASITEIKRLLAIATSTQSRFAPSPNLGCGDASVTIPSALLEANTTLTFTHEAFVWWMGAEGALTKKSPPISTTITVTAAHIPTVTVDEAPTLSITKSDVLSVTARGQQPGCSSDAASGLLTYAWSMVVKSSGVAEAHLERSNMSPNPSIISLPANMLAADQTYTLTVTVSVGTGSTLTSSSASVEVVVAASPLVAMGA